ncbi:MAG TPA: bifunctional riboflavin kinase/FAD synthetase [Dissulfurispiraceae bacterium]|nr:bifunctional riboflavin kinase/FAD synthetase [Dissulfurispiraceae bacterium]
MEIIRGLPVSKTYRAPVVTIGNFDGVHIGHQKIIRAVVNKASELHGTAVAMTFEPHPVRVLLPERGLKLINSFEEKARLIADQGIKSLICIEFDRNFAHTDAEEFIRKIIVEHLKARWIVVGHNYAFGRGKKGNASLLRRRGKKYGFGVTVVRYAKVAGGIVSSSRVRQSITAGKVGDTAKMLGRAYYIDGVVIKGAGRGNALLKTPTANLQTDDELLPKEGVYAVRVSIGKRLYDGVANIGRNPTFKEGRMSYEVHIFDFHENLLGQKLRLHFIGRIRDEKKFSSVEDLFDHIKMDIETARRILKKRKTPVFV